MEKQNDFGKYIRRFWMLYAASMVFFILLFTAIGLGWLGFMPSFEELENPNCNLASEIYSADQVLLGKYYIENRSNVHYNDLSVNMVNALVATEDIRFEKHSGVDFRSISRVIFKNLLGGNRSSGGGSTITQQLAKNLFPREEHPGLFKMVFIKLKEWITAVKLERNYTKEEILAMYLNTVDFGNQSFGIKSAAKTYFNKTPDMLNIEESALLIGILKAPSYYSPVHHPEKAMERRNIVMQQMEKYNYISRAQFDSLKLLPVDMSRFHVQDQNTGIATYFREYLRMYLTDWIQQHPKPDKTYYNLYKDGLKIYTTINSKMQKYAEEAVDEHLGDDLQPSFYKHWQGVKGAPFDWTMSKEQIQSLYDQAMRRSDRYILLKSENVPEETIRKIFDTPVKMTVFTWNGDKDTTMSPMDSIKYYKYFLLSGLMSMEPQTGYVRAYVGGIDYRYFKYDHVMMSKRQVGSTFKPFVYTLAMQEGEFSPCSKVPNLPVTFDLPDGTKYTPKNCGKEKEGEMVTLKFALANSINQISAYLMKRYSPLSVIKICRKMGMTSDIVPVPSICLGSADLSLYEMVGAMSTFANKGVYTEPVFITRIEDKNGNIIWRDEFVPKRTDAISEETAYLMITLMKGVVESGTGGRIRATYKLMNPIAGKTGTTSNNSDGWFMGLTPSLVTGVWVGCDDRSVHFRSTALGQGATMALPIWALYMQKVYADKSLGIKKDDFERPSRPLSVEVDCAKYDAKHKDKETLNPDGNN